MSFVMTLARVKSHAAIEKFDIPVHSDTIALRFSRYIVQSLSESQNAPERISQSE